MHPRAALRPLLLVLPLAWAGLLGACGGAPEPETPPPSEPTATWDLTRLGPLPKPLREWTTPADVRVLVLAEGLGEPAGPTTPMELRILGRLRDGGTFMTDVIAVNRRPEQPSEPIVPGFRAAMDGLRVGERRLVLIPAAQGYGAHPPASTIPRFADLVYDVTWVRLKVQDLVLGAGAQARLGQTLRVHYRGTLTDGTVFDDSRTNNKDVPLPLPLRRPDGKSGGVIEGWVQGIPGMRVGGMRRLEIPWHLGYGSRGSGTGKVPPYADLVFVVELFGVDEG
jgi:FKBP-type peptidyl-prolyl cis-trans isomerase